MPCSTVVLTSSSSLANLLFIILRWIVVYFLWKRSVWVDTFHISLSRNVMCWVQMINFITSTELSEHVPKTFHECQKSKFMSINNFGWVDRHKLQTKSCKSEHWKITPNNKKRRQRIDAGAKVSVYLVYLPGTSWKLPKHGDWWGVSISIILIPLPRPNQSPFHI